VIFGISYGNCQHIGMGLPTIHQPWFTLYHGSLKQIMVLDWLLNGRFLVGGDQTNYC
jgi:hypothetical protein